MPSGRISLQNRKLMQFYKAYSDDDDGKMQPEPEAATDAVELIKKEEISTEEEGGSVIPNATTTVPLQY
jgi:hypothetical protein